MRAAAARPSFEAHWSGHGQDALPAAKLAEAAVFLQPVLQRIRNSSRPPQILDAGCGDGVHAVALAGQGDHEYFGVDLAYPAAATTRNRRAAAGGTRGLVAVGDLARLPCRPASFDVIFCYGVLAYTGAPQQVLDELVRVCRPGGVIGVWMYPRRGGLSGAAFRLARGCCRRLGPVASKPLVWITALLLPVLPVQSGLSLRTATWRQCVEVVEVNLLPPVLDFFDVDAVVGWFRSRGLEIVSTDETRPVTVWARRSA